MPEIIGIDHIYIAVTSLERSERFYDAVLSVLGFLLSLFYFLRVTRTSGFCRTRSRTMQNRLWATDWFRRLRSWADRLWSRADRLWSRAAFLRATLMVIVGPQSGRSDTPQCDCKRDRQHSPCGRLGRKMHIVSYILQNDLL